MVTVRCIFYGVCIERCIPFLLSETIISERRKLSQIETRKRSVAENVTLRRRKNIKSNLVENRAHFGMLLKRFLN